MKLTESLLKYLLKDLRIVGSQYLLTETKEK